MTPIRIHDDIVPLGEFKTHASRLLREMHEQGRHLVITQNGRPAAVLVLPADYDRFTEKERFIASVRRGLAEAEAGLGIPAEELGDDINAALDRRFGPIET
jgi:prevent-host-death family protein